MPNAIAAGNAKTAQPVASLTDRGATGFAILAAILVLVPLLAIFVYLVIKGVGSINSRFSPRLPSRRAKSAAAWRTLSSARD